MDFPEELERLLAALEKAGFEAWAVGGGVRDTLRGVTPQDWDVTTSARPEEVLALFGGWAIPTGLAHGTVTVKQDGRPFEVTTYRTDGAYRDHRHPEAVTFTASLTEDLARRDFTVNAIAVDRRGHLADPWGGREDLRAGILRVVGDPSRRFAEDALRIMRGLRFSSQLGFTAEPATAAALHRCAHGLRDIAAERIAAEMTGLLCGENVLEVLLAYPDVLGVFLPEVLPCVGFAQHSKFHIYDVWSHIAHAVALVPPEPVLRWAMLLHDLGKPRRYTQEENGTSHFFGHADLSAAMAEEICRRLRLPGAMSREIVTLVAWHDRVIPVTEKAIRRALHDLGEETFFRLCQVKRADNLAQNPEYCHVETIRRAEDMARQLLAEGACLSLRDLAVKGEDLLALGYRGTAIGAALESLLDRVLDGTLPNDKAALLAALTTQDDTL